MSADDYLDKLMARRELIRTAARGTVVAALGGLAWYALDDELTRKARAQTRPDGRPRLPPGQRVLRKLKPMGGTPGSPRVTDFRLRVYGEVERPFTLDYRELLSSSPVTVEADVHCVTGWSVLGAQWTGARIRDLAARAGAKTSARLLFPQSLLS